MGYYAHWIIKYSGGYCSNCGKRVSVKTLTGNQYFTYLNCPGIRQIRFKYCPFCGCEISEEPELIEEE